MNLGAAMVRVVRYVPRQSFWDIPAECKRYMPFGDNFEGGGRWEYLRCRDTIYDFVESTARDILWRVPFSISVLDIPSWVNKEILNTAGRFGANTIVLFNQNTSSAFCQGASTYILLRMGLLWLAPGTILGNSA